MSEFPSAGSGRPPPATLFPLVRHLSVRATPLLARTPLTPNQITTLSIVSGLAAVCAVLQAGQAWSVAAGVLLVLSYVLDNCDGEVAAIKNMRSVFGARLDTFGDWLVHAAFFAALGLAASDESGDTLWAWFGWMAAAGGTVNYMLGLWLDRRRATGPAAAEPAQAGDAERWDRPENAKDWVIYVFRELFRADFCFIVLALAACDLLWVLLPLAAAGAQAYWVSQIFAGGKVYHV